MGIFSKLFGNSPEEPKIAAVPAPASGTDPTEYVIKVLRAITPLKDVDPSDIPLKGDLLKDVGLDKLDIVETLMAMEDTYGFEFPPEAENFSSVDEIRRALAKKIGYTGEFSS